MYWPPSLCASMRARSLPDDLVLKIALTEQRIHYGFQVVRRMGITVQVDTPRRLQDSVQLQQPDAHEGEISSHVLPVCQLCPVDEVIQSRQPMFDLLHPLLLHVA